MHCQLFGKAEEGFLVAGHPNDGRMSTRVELFAAHRHRQPLELPNHMLAVVLTEDVLHGRVEVGSDPGSALVEAMRCE